MQTDANAVIMIVGSYDKKQLRLLRGGIDMDTLKANVNFMVLQDLNVKILRVSQ